MAPNPSAPAGLEVDSHGNPIPYEQRTQDDKDEVARTVKKAMHGSKDDIQKP